MIWEVHASLKQARIAYSFTITAAGTSPKRDTGRVSKTAPGIDLPRWFHKTEAFIGFFCAQLCLLATEASWQL
jgi:hypothetical protein